MNLEMNRLKVLHQRSLRVRMDPQQVVKVPRKDTLEKRRSLKNLIVGLNQGRDLVIGDLVIGDLVIVHGHGLVPIPDQGKRNVRDPGMLQIIIFICE